MPLPKKTPRTDQLNMRTRAGQKDRWYRQALMDGYEELSDWVRDVCDAHANGVPFTPRRGAQANDSGPHSGSNDRDASGPRRKVA